MYFAAILGENRQRLGPAVERGAILGAIKAELNGVYPAGSDGESRAGDNDADQDTGKETELKDDIAMARSEAYWTGEICVAESISHS